MKITLIRARVSNAPEPPLGILSIATLLNKKGYNVQILDPSPEDVKFFKEIKDFNPDVLGISILTTQYERAKEIAEWAKENLKNVILVGGGIHPTALPKRTLKELGLDAVVIGEGEITFLDLVENLSNRSKWKNIKGLCFKLGDEIIINEPRELIEDLDTIPYPDRSLINFEQYLRPPGNIRGLIFHRATSLISSRGCPYYCTFCSSHTLFGRKIRYRSVDNVIAEIDELVNKYKIDALWFLDDTLMEKPDWTSNLCKEIRRRQYNFKWGCQGHVRKVTKELLQEMKNSGCVQIEFGVESGSPRILKVLKKGTTPDDVKRAFSICRSLGIRTLANFMIGNPEEKVEDLEMSYRLARIIKPDHVVVTFTTPMPGSELYDYCKKIGKLNGKEVFNERWTIRQIDEPIIPLSLSKKEMMRFRAKFDNTFFFTNIKGYLKHPNFVIDVIKSILKNPRAYLRGLSYSIKTKRLNHIVETIWEEYNKI